jgi:hypothetical protein
MLVRTEILHLIRQWFRGLNDHAPVETMLNMLAPDGFEMKFPEGIIRTAQDFMTWHSDVTSKFFDQIHELKNIRIDINGDEADVTVYVNWIAHTWKAPDAYSGRLDFDAFQTWKVVKAADGSIRIKRYVVDQMEDNK